MSRQTRWLGEESRQWEREGLITSAQATLIRARYPTPGAPWPWNTIIFSGFGAIISGLGIILLFAYNWHSLHKFAKLGVLLAGIAGLHTAGLRLFLSGGGWRQLGEAISLLGTMLFGAGIWLVAQIYHIDEHFPNAFLLWGGGALALAWVMPSRAQGLLAVVVLSVWGCSEGWGFERAVYWAPALVLGGAGWLAWRLRSSALLAAAFTAFALVLCATVSAVRDELLLSVALDCAAAFVAASILARGRAGFPSGARLLAFFGWAGFLLCVYLLSFPGLVEQLLGWKSPTRPPGGLAPKLQEWLPFGGCLVLWAWVGWRWLPGRRAAHPPLELSLEDVLVPLTVIICQVLARASFSTDSWILAGAFNLVFLAVAGVWMARGARQGLLGTLLAGAGLLAALTTARYFDLFESLAARGTVFVVVGGLFFAQGVLFRRASRNAVV